MRFLSDKLKLINIEAESLSKQGKCNCKANFFLFSIFNFSTAMLPCFVDKRLVTFFLLRVDSVIATFRGGKKTSKFAADHTVCCPEIAQHNKQ